MRKQILKRTLSMLLALAMVVSMVPAGLFDLFSLHAHAAGTVANGKTIDVLDGKTTGAELYAAFMAVMNEPTTGGYDTVFQKTFKFGSTTVYNNDTEISVSNGTLTVQKSTGTSRGKTTYGGDTNFTIQVYHNVTATVDTSANADGAGAVTATGKVYYKKQATITVTDVDGYKAELYNGETKVADLSDDAGWTYTIAEVTASAAYTVKYVSEAATEYSASVNVVNGDWGTATLGTNTGIAGAEIGLTVTPNADSSSAKYTYAVSVTNGSYNASTGKVTVAGTGDVVVTVTFTKTDIHFGTDKNTEIEYNGWYTGANADGFDLDALKQEIFNKLDVESLPAGATWQNVTIQYYPWQTGKISGDWSQDTELFALDATPGESTLHNRVAFGYRFYAGDTDITEKVRITYNGLYIEAEITLIEARKKSEIYYTDPTVTFEEQADIDDAVLGALSAQSTGTITATLADNQTLPSGGNTATLTYNVTVAEDENYLGNTTTVTITATAKNDPASITFESVGIGSGSVNFGGLTADGTLAEGTHTLTITPSDLNGADGSAMYVEKVEVNGTALTGSYSGGVYTASYAVANNNSYTVKVTYGTATLTNVGGTLELNGYVDKTGNTDDYSARLDDLKGKIIQAVLGGGTITDYTVYIWFNPGLMQPEDYYETDSFWITSYADRLEVPAYDEEGSLKVKIVKAASSDGKIVSLTLTDAEVTTKESREPAQVTLGSFTKEQNTLDDFKQAILDAITTTPAGAKDSLTIELVPTGNLNEYYIDYTVANDGETWVASNGRIKNNVGEDATVTWVVKVYKITFQNWVDANNNGIAEDGEYVVVEGYSKEYPYGTTTDNIEIPTVTKDHQLDANGNIIARYTFAGWNPEVNTVTGEATYTATYDRVVEKYTITWVNGNETTTEEYEYGATPVAPTASKTSTAQYHFTNGTWGTIATVTGDATYTATFTEELRSYTITWVNGDETTEVTYNYGETPVAPAATKSDDKADNGNTTYYYTDGKWPTIATVTGDATYTATFTKNAKEYTVTWIVDGVETTNTHAYGTQITVLADPVKEGHTFAGWTPAVVTTMGAENVTYTATWTVNNYTVTWDVDGNKTTNTHAYGSQITVPADPTKTGYTFTGWTPTVVTTMGAANVTYTATWKINQYTVTYKDTDGTVLHTATYDYNAAIEEYKPTKDNHAFGGWVEGTVPAKMPAENLTFTVKEWVANAYQITWDVDGNLTYSTEQFGATVALPVTPTKEGYTFAGWDVNGTVYKAGWTMGGENVTATATWTVNKYTVTWDVDGVETTNTHDFGTKITVPADPTKEGYTFAGWTPAVVETMGAASVTYTATWTINQYTITFVDWNGDVIETLKQNYGTDITAPADPTRTGYTFKGWDTTVPATMPAEDMTIQATYTINQYTITFVDWNDQVIATLKQDYGTAVTAPADPVRTGYTFAGWDTAVPTTMPAGDMTIQATYEINKYTITWVVDGVETKETYDYGTMPSFKGSTDKAATAQYTYTFTGWDKDLATVTGDVTYTAQYSSTVNKYTVTWVTGSGTTTEIYEYGATPSFKGSTDKATADHIKYTFTGWDKTIATVTGNVTYTAQYSSELDATNGTVGINKYHTANSDKAALVTLRTDILQAAGLSTDSRYVVTAEVGLQTVNLTATVEIKDGSIGSISPDWVSYLKSQAEKLLANELNKSSYSFVITDTKTGLSKTVTMQMVDNRPSAGLVDVVIDEVKVFGKNDSLDAYIESLIPQVNPKGLSVKHELTQGSLIDMEPGVTVTLVYTVTYADDANYIGDTATLTVNVQTLLNKCTVIPGSSLTAGGSLTVVDSDDNKTVPGNKDATITVVPNSNKIVETITVYKNGTLFATYTTDKITYSSQNATVSFKSDGTEIADVYTVEVEYSDKYLNLVSGTIKYCMDYDNLTNAELKALVFGGIFDGSCAPMNAGNVTLEYAYIGVGGYNLWQDITKGPAINLGSLTHKFGEDGSETIKLTYSDAKYGSFEQEIVLNVFDSCYNNTVTIQTVAPSGVKYDFSVKYEPTAREYLGVSYFKTGEAIKVTLTPSGDDIKGMLEQVYNKSYSESAAYIKEVKVYKLVGEQWVEVESTMERGTGELIDWDNITSGIGNPMAYTATVTFTPEGDTAYKVVAEYDVLTLEQENESAQLPMYQAGKGYDALVPSAQEIIDKILGKDYVASFLAANGGAFTVEFSTDVAQATWTAVTDENLLALYDGTTIKIRITWNPDEETNKTYYPVAVQADLTLVDLRAATNVQGSVPTTPVEYVEESQLIANLKNAMGLGILSNGSLIDVEYDVNYTIEILDHGNYATVVVTYHGSENYKPCKRTFDNVPVADIPDNATIKVIISGAAVNITNNAGTAQNWDPSTELYTVIGNGTYNFKFTPVSGKAIQSVTVNGEAVELTYEKGIATFSVMLTEKEHYEVVVETVDSVWVLEDERVYDFAYGVMKPVNGNIVDAAVKYPPVDSIDYSKVILEYLARAEGTVTVELGNIDLGFTVIELGTIDVELGELWLDPNAEVTEYDLDKLIDELIEEVIDKVSHGELAATDVVNYLTEKLQSLTIGAHKFGSAGDKSVETIRISYADDKYILAEVVTDVTIHDPRIVTELQANDCEVTYGYSLEQLLAASGAGVWANGAAIDGLTIGTDDLYLHAGAQTITLYFAGDETYQPCEITINVTVNKATADLDYDSQFVIYGDNYEYGLVISPDFMPDGTACNPDLIEFMIGMDMHTLLDFGADQDIVGLDQAIGYIQLRLPQSIRELPLVGEYLQGEFTLSEFTDLVNSLSDILGIDAGSMETLNQVLEAITGITDRMDIKIIIKDEDFHPTNVGVYIAGAVTVDSDFETVYTADYLIIAPQTNEVEIDWNTPINNSVVELPTWIKMDKGASVVGDPVDGFTVKSLILGLNAETSEFLSTDIYGNIKANIWVNPAEIKNNGAYVQIAYGVLWGNELYYSVPLVRAFAIVPEVVDVELRGDSHEANNDLLKEFDNTGKGFNVYVTDGEGNVLVYTYDGSKSEWLTVYYIGIQANGKLYNSTEKPVHAGVYTAIAIYAEYNNGGSLSIIELEQIANALKDGVSVEDIDLKALFDTILGDLDGLIRVGADTGILVITPTDSTVDVENSLDNVVTSGVGHKPSDMVTSGSTVAGLKPDTTIISVGIGSNGTFTQNGWDAINGTVNVDFPRWMEELLEKYAPSIIDGIKVGELADKLTAKLPEILAALEEVGAPAELLDALTGAVERVTAVLKKMPADASVSFIDDIAYNNVGVYAVVAIVTDSDHYPSMDAGLLVIRPEVHQFELKWNYEDDNHIWTRELLKYFDWMASAYQNGVLNDSATALIKNQFITISPNGELVIYTNPDDLPNGAYVNVAYIPLELDGVMYVSNLIARPMLLVPNNAKVEFVDENGNVNNDRHFEFNNKEQGMQVQVTVNGVVITPDAGDLKVYYYGVQTNGKLYESETPPKHAGAYVVVAVYKDFDDDGTLIAVGVGVGAMVIEPTDSSIEVNGGEVTYDGNEHSANVDADSTVVGLTPDTVIISGTVYPIISGDIKEIGLDALYGNVNIDFPAWLDKLILPELGSYAEGITAVDLAALLAKYRDQALALIPEDTLVELGVDDASVSQAVEILTQTYDALIKVLNQLPNVITITFEDNKTYTEPGTYLYYAFVLDSDHLPVDQETSARTGILTIKKKESMFGAWHEVVTYDGNGHTVFVPNDYFGPVKYDYFTMILDRKNNHVNFILDEDLQFIMDKVEALLGMEIPEEMSVQTLNALLSSYDLTMDDFANAIIYVLDAVLAEMEVPSTPKEYSNSTYRDLMVIKNLLSNLPEDGTISINGDLPVNVGAYEFYMFGYSRYYESVDASAVLFIEPIRIVIDANDADKIYGETDPTLGYDIVFKGLEGRENVYGMYDHWEIEYDASKFGYTVENTDVTIGKINAHEYVIDMNDLPADFWNNVVIEIVREEGENVGEYAINVNVVVNSGNYEVTSNAAGIFTIHKKDVYIFVSDKDMHIEDNLPELTFKVEGLVNPKDLGVISAVTGANGMVAGQFEINVTYAANGNYNVNVVTGTLTVTDHNWINKAHADYLYRPADCEYAAVYRQSCSICGKAHETDTFVYGTALGHDYSDEWTVEGTKHWHECVRCDAKSDVADHVDTDQDHACDNGCDVKIGTCEDSDKDHACDYGCKKVYGEHTDLNKDHKCDYGCSEPFGTCEDKDLDHKCDYGCSEVHGKHVDEDKNHACDYGCTVAIGTCGDTNNDHKCDYGCAKVYGPHEDTDKNHKCDYGCSESIGTCEDTDKDHKCDHGCGASFGQHADPGKDHKCDYGCKDPIGTCEDVNPKDHACDYGCGAYFGIHEDTDKDHMCNYCGQLMSACADENADHKCDNGCDKVYGTCEDKDQDHDCDYGCDKVYGTCEDGDLDHDCDYGCDKVYGTCEDKDLDHDCDYGCDKVYGTCEDKDLDHDCDYGCNKVYGEHVDGDTDHVCDYGCKESIGTCADANLDHKCDYGCDKVYGTHEDSNSDHICEYGCKVTIGTCADADRDHDCDYGCNKGYGTCEDGNFDHKCDYGCGQTYGEHKDNNADHKCDYGCAESIGTCADDDKDHACDYGCDKSYGVHEDTGKDHKCDYGCKVSIGTCEDKNFDHKCDYGCSQTYGEHKDNNADHKCDYGCAEPIGTCADDNKDHACDYGCGKSYGAHEDAGKDHKCDYGCKEAIGTCEDKNFDHKCDYGCSQTYGEHKDNNADHKCDYGCAEPIGACADDDKDHACDHGCGKIFSECTDEDKDHYCDYDRCTKILGNCEDGDLDHTCDYGCDMIHGTCEDQDLNHKCDYGCDKVYGEHVDAGKDHACDYGCQEPIGTCEDGDLDHDCDYGCDKVYGTCEDADKDHDCDYGCDKVFGTHADSDKNHTCDYGCSVGIGTCADGDKDHTCDYGCGKIYGTHADTDKDHTCDYGCTEKIGACEDADKDHDCDYGCDKTFGTHTDTDKNHACDYGCAEKIGDCEDADKDHACDYGCDKTFGTHEDTDYNHICDYGCSVKIGACEDADKDHDCDYGCDKYFGEHIDTDKNHTCEYGCSMKIGTCEDADKDHDCDYGCDKTFGTHEDTDHNHVCDYGCSVKIGDCEDADKDHACDYGCDKVFGDCADEDKDHACDYGCDKTFGDCEDADKDHACDYGCDKIFGDCVDTDKDHACDYGCDKTFGDCVDEDKDHDCDYGCDKIFGDCEDADKDHVCDYGCEKVYGDCVDSDKDHDCDYGCDKTFGECEDADKDHACDYGCDKTFGECVDADKDHACDYGCDKIFGDCVDTDKDHDCDYGCDKTFGECEDTDKDHACDYGCDKTFGTCEDADKDHDCDYGCDKTFGDCVDEDKDHACDYGCDKTFGECEDADKNHACDYGCEKTFGECEDTDKDHACDYGCDKVFGDCVDEDKDHACDYGCDKVFGDCVDADKDHDCDYGCEKVFGECEDADKNHACDYGCEKTFGECEDTDKDHACDYGCDKTFGDCADEDKDHACDYGCEKTFGDCEDADKDHACDYGCDKTFGDCADEDKDHACDYGCDKTFGEHADSDKNHSCDYGCSESIGTCEDADKDHACDYGCDKTFGDCEDTDKDHACDYGCDKTFGTCEDADKDHACDYGCDKTFGTCEDADKDHACDYGCDKTFGEHADSDKNHSCDYGCSESIGTCEDADRDHTCDYGCGKVFGDCVDSNNDLLCDVCGKALGTPDGSVDTPAIGIPGLTGNNVYGFEVDFEKKILFVDAVKTGMTVGQFKEQLAVQVFNDADKKAAITVSVRNGNDIVVLEDDELIRTCAWVTLEAENAKGVKTTVNYDVVVIGDVNRNGEVDSGDASLIQRYFFDEVDLNALQVEAADTNRNGEIDSGDAVKNQVKYNDAEQYRTNLHSYTETVSNNDATCTEDGTVKMACTADHICSEKTIERPLAGSALGHNYVRKEDAFVCEVCGSKYAAES